MPRYLGDIKETDFDDPHRRSHCWKLIQKIVKNLKLHIKQLQGRNRRLKNRIYSLQSLKQHFRQ